jgi:hypothetical protein
MPWHIIKNEAKISAIVRHLTSRQRKIKIFLDGEKGAFRSKIRRVDRIVSDKGEKAQIVIEGFDPKEGNDLIRSASVVRMEFIIKKRFCRCKMAYLGPVHDGGDFLFQLGFPDSVKVHEERLEDRVELEMLEPVSVRITVGKESKARKAYDLPVVNCSRHGLGLLVTQKESALLEELNVGDRIRGMVLYAPWAVTRMDGKVVHKTELQDGDQRGCVILGVKSRDLIANSETSKR